MAFLFSAIVLSLSVRRFKGNKGAKSFISCRTHRRHEPHSYCITTTLRLVPLRRDKLAGSQSSEEMRIHPRDIVTEDLVCHRGYGAGPKRSPVKTFFAVSMVTAQIAKISTWAAAAAACRTRG